MTDPAEVTVGGVTIAVVRGDITRQDGVDAVVNAANAWLRPGGGVAGAIHRAAGPGLAQECRPLAPVGPGQSVITGGHRLPNPWVIHCLGPVYGRDEPADRLLAACYRGALALADKRGLESVAFPAISTGVFGYPMEEAARVAVDAVVASASDLRRVRRVRFVLFDAAAWRVHRDALRRRTGRGDGPGGRRERGVSGDLTERLTAQARRFAESGAAPVVPRPAATVLLLRPAATGFEVYLLRRAASMAFASRMYAFPGGAVDPGDADGAPLTGRWADRLGRPEPQAQAVARAAIRETAEETGVRLAPADLMPWTRWITPEFEPRRYDTHFFVAALPPGQQPADLSGEADRTEWLAPARALRRLAAGEIMMLPPTSVTLRELTAYESVGAVLAAAAGRDAATPVLPRVEHRPDGTIRLVF